MFKLLSKFISPTLFLISGYFIFQSLEGYKGILHRSLNFYFLFLFLFFSVAARYLFSLNFYKIILLFSDNLRNVVLDFVLYVYAKSNIFKYLPIKVSASLYVFSASSIVFIIISTLILLNQNLLFL